MAFDSPVTATGTGLGQTATVYNVKTDFNATGNGTTNDTTAIQAAINKAAADGGGIVYLPPGTYLLSTGLLMKTGVQLSGVPGLSILKAGVAMFMIDSFTTSQTKWGVRNVVFDLNNITSGTNYGIVIEHNTCDYVTIEGCEFKNFGTTTNNRAGIRLVGSYKSTRILNCLFLGPGSATLDNSYGIYCEALADGLLVVGNRFEGCYIACALWLAGANAPTNFVVANNVIASFGKYGIYMLGVSYGTVTANAIGGTVYVGGAGDSSGGITMGIVSTTGCNRVLVVGNSLKSGGEISCYDSSNIVIDGNSIFGAQAAGIEVGGNINGSNDVTVVGNYVDGGIAGSNFFIGPVVRCLVANNLSEGAGNDGMSFGSGAAAIATSRVTIIGNSCFGNTLDGISVIAGTSAGNSDITIAHNICTGNGVRGIEVNSNATNTRIRLEFNECLNNTGAPILIGALATHVRQFGNITATTDYDSNLFTPVAQTALTYGATVNTDAGANDYFTLAITNGTAFTMAAPTNPVAGSELIYDIKNSSGGAHGVITWNAAYLNGGAGTVGTGALTGIANGKRRIITFRYDGTNWIEVSRTADI